MKRQVPAGFHRIRYYGFLGARHRRDKLDRSCNSVAKGADTATGWAP
jgi:hypothetical protein